MNSIEIFNLALGINSPWEIKDLKFDTSSPKKELRIEIGFKKGSKFPDETGKLCPVYDTQKRKWRHLNFFEHKCYLSCKVPRIKTTAGKVRLVEVPWARPNSGFTLLFEAYIMALIEGEMPLNQIGQFVNEDPHRMWTIFNYWIDRGYSSDQPKQIKKLGIDETSRRKKHKYVTIGVDLDEKKVIHATKGKGKTAVKRIKKHIEKKDLDPEKIKDISMDLSPSFIAGVSENFPKAEVHFDRFHVVKLLNEAMDEVRKKERQAHQELKGHKYTFLKNKNKLSKTKNDELAKLIKLFPILGEAYRLKELFNDLWELETKEDAISFLKYWFEEVEKSGIEPFKKFAKTVKIHMHGIVNFCETRINNGILEGINNKIQLAKRRARGFRRSENFINMIYFLCGKLKFDYPLYTT